MPRELRINERIHANEIRLIREAGGNLGVIPMSQALSMARESGLDLVEVDPNSTPPVCRILDYGKWKYQQTKKERDARKHQRAAMVHQVRMRPRIGQNDMERKARTVERLLREGDKVKVSVMFRGREMSHQELGHELLAKVLDILKTKAAAERPPSMDGRFLNVILTPTHKKPATAQPADAEETPIA